MRWSMYAEGGALTAALARFPLNYTGWGHPPGGSPGISSCTLVMVGATTCVQDSVTEFTALQVASPTPIGTGQPSGRSRVGRRWVFGVAPDYVLSVILRPRSPDTLPALMTSHWNADRLGDRRVTAFFATASMVAGVYAEEQLALNDQSVVTGAHSIDGVTTFGRKFSRVDVSDSRRVW